MQYFLLRNMWAACLVLTYDAGFYWSRLYDNKRPPAALLETIQSSISQSFGSGIIHISMITSTEDTTKYISGEWSDWVELTGKQHMTGIITLYNGGEQKSTTEQGKH